MMNLISPDCAIDHKDLLTRCMGNAQFAARILEAFQRQLSGDLEALDAAILAGDAAEVAVIAHRVKGASSNVSGAGSIGLPIRWEHTPKTGSSICFPVVARTFAKNNGNFANPPGSSPF